MGKRGNGEGSIYKRADGRWEARISLEGGERKALYGKTRAEAARKLTDALKAVSRGEPLVRERETVGQFLDDWLENFAKAKIRPSTFASYAHYVRRHLIPGLGVVRLARLTPHQVEVFMNDKQGEGLAPRTVQYMRAILRHALNRALRDELVARNAAAQAESPHVERFPVTPLTGEQARAFLASIRTNRLEALYTLVLACGLRQGEALGLRWVDLDFERAELSVRQSLQRVNGKLQLVKPKTDRSRRTVSIPRFALAALREHRDRQKFEERLAGERWRHWEDAGLIFTSTVGTPLDASNVTHGFQKLLETAGLPRQRFHDLRHACASFLLSQGVSHRVVMETLGHSQIGLTMNLYSHVAPALQRDAAERMDALFAQAVEQ